MNDETFKKSVIPALQWLKNHAPDFVFECLSQGMSQFTECASAHKSENKALEEYVVQLETIRDLQRVIIDMLEERLREIEKPPF